MRSKAFIVTLVLMPVLMGASAGVQVLFKKFEDTREKKFAVVDRSPGGKIAEALKADEAIYNTHLINDAEGKRIHSPIAAFAVRRRRNPADAAASGCSSHALRAHAAVAWARSTCVKAGTSAQRSSS